MFKELEISSFGVGLFLLLIIVGVIGIIVFLKIRYSKYKIENLIEANKGKKILSHSAKTKFPEMDVFKYSRPFFNFGLLIAVALAFVAMNWTTYEHKIKVNLNDLVLTEEVEVEVPRTNEPPPPPPPPPPPVIQEVPNTVTLAEDQPVFENQEVTIDTKVESVVFVEKKTVAPPPPPPPPPPAPDEEEIFKVVEQMPRFPGCEDKKTEDEKLLCSKTKLLEYIYERMRYPAIARENGVEGQVVIQFVVTRHGTIDDIVILRDIGAGCGEAALEVIEGMNNMGKKWTPGKQRGRPVKVLFTLPVKFKIASAI